jgi:ADP-ribosylglycohydrolase
VSNPVESRRRALAALRALAVGDAMGAATEGYRPDEVEAVYDAPIAELVEPVNLYPESAPDRALGEVGPVTRGALAAARRLTNWVEDEWPLVPPDWLGWSVPLGIAVPAGQTGRIAEIAALISGGITAAAGAAVAAAISAGVGLFMPRDALGQAARAAVDAGAPSLAQRIMAAAGAGQESGGRLGGLVVGERFPPGPEPADAAVFALGVAFAAQSVRRAIPQAVNQGGLASLSAALAGALCATWAPATAVEPWADEVVAVNELELEPLADALMALRRAAEQGTNLT